MKAFYGLVCSCPNPAIDWYQQMSRQLVSDANDLGNFRFHLAGGSYHTLLRDPTFYTESSAGPAFADWLGDLLSIRGGRNGHGGNWTNAACPTCLVELPCTP